MKKSDLKDYNPKGENTKVYTPKGIVFIPTYNCTAMCNHCNNDFKSHDLSKKMDITKAIEIIKKMQKEGLNSIQVTGGEITMYPEFLPAIIPSIKHLAIRMNKPPTNCYIAENTNIAKKFFEELKQAGYTSGFRISIDPYHKNIPIAHIAKFVAMYGECFKLSSLTIGSCYYDENKIFEMYDEFVVELIKCGFRNVEYSKTGKKFIIDGEKIKFGIWLPTRPSWKPLTDKEVLLNKIDKTVACLGPDGLAYLWIEPDFKVRSCSCNGNGFLDYFIIGDLSKESLRDVIKRAQKNEIFKVLANFGAEGLRSIVNQGDIIMDTEKEYSFMCELCNEILGSKELKEKLEKNIDKIL